MVDFEWYLSVLVDLAYVANVNVGARIRDQLVDVVGRVKAARRYAVKLMVKVLGDDTFSEQYGEDGSCAEVLWAAAWICGEYCGYEYHGFLRLKASNDLFLANCQILRSY